ncbi:MULTISPECIES: EMYY motif lipoprotein [unclassified Staphylococcus]|uniref:EMYY motif lipoprotein n=1 Tax=unclassified Staphylococcus TaxID=91994 RepID=UPI0021D130A8|nr:MULTISPECIES: EMYY motif lipoprotein [unclassified Staphylococcus]UXR78743.1 EMYY motif lipoprotein [Staphylococcus sp. IVB6227]UXR82903.1 EMYY motif lipoprotein [Staphylococcus sp. IVB6214]
MKKIKKLLTLSMVSIMMLTACGGQSDRDKEVFDAQLSRVEAKEKAFNETLDNLELQKLNKWVKGETTDKHKESFQDLEENLRKELIPKFNDYQQEAEKLPTSNDKLKEIKRLYMKGLAGKEQEIERLEQFVSQYIKSIETNENILNDTQSFESHRAQVESYIADAQTSEAGTKEAAALEEVLKKNNDEIKKSVEDAGENPDAQVFKTKTIPLIQQQIRALNQKQLHNNSVSHARQSAIEMYYNLEHYYKERTKSIAYSTSLEKADVNTLMTNSKDLKHYDRAFQQAHQDL